MDKKEALSADTKSIYKVTHGYPFPGPSVHFQGKKIGINCSLTPYLELVYIVVVSSLISFLLMLILNLFLMDKFHCVCVCVLI